MVTHDILLVMVRTVDMTNEGEAPHVLVVDDDKRLRELLRRFLADHGFLVTTAANSGDARAKLANLHFDALVLDVMMPGEDGLQLTAAIKETGAVPILLLTAMDEAEHRVAGLEQGADDYLGKPFEPRELVLRLNNIMRRHASPPVVDIVRFGAFEFDRARGELRQGGAPVNLTASETTLLSMLTRAPGAVLSREQLGAQPQVAARAVDVQITRLRRKIERDPKDPRYLITVRGAGYALRTT